MKKKSIAVAALASCLALSATFTGCSLVSTNSKADMAQEIATVNIAKLDNFKDSSLNDYKDAITGGTAVIKRDLVSYFLNIGYSYIQNGSTYADTFNMLVDALVDNAILVQYSTMALLEAKAKEENKTAQAIISEYNAFDSANDKTSAQIKAQKYEYLLEESDILLAKYNLYSSINSAIDSYEKTIIEEESDYTGTATRTTPVNLNTEQDYYYPADDNGNLNYNVYTGYAGYLLDESGAYKDDALDGTTTATRIKAYNKFLKSLRDNDLIDSSEAGKLRQINELQYIQDEYVSQLESRIINKYYDVYEKQQEEILLNDNYIDNIYQELLKNQTSGYETASAFESALGNLSSSSFLLYSPDTTEDNELEGAIDGYSQVTNGRFGYVYNILLPFSAKQNAQLSELKSVLSEDDDYDYYYIERNKILSQIKTEDQRSAWFNGTTDYSFKASESGITNYYGDSDYLFFEGNLTDSEEGGRYKKLQAYDGRYAYNGSVYENEDGSYTLIGNELDIDGMLEEFSAYVNYVLTGNKEPVNNYTVVSDYYENDNFYKDEDEEEIDYTKFLYAYGKIDLGGFNKSDLLNSKAQSNQYLAMSAVNELQFAYTTDTSVLSQYVGYSVSAYETSFIKEFEYAAKLAISAGEGAFTVCAGDYGWHLIYVTYVFDGGEVYNNLDWKNNVKVEGTFENLFFEWIKGNDLSDITTSRRSKIINDFNKEDVTVIKYQTRYQDLLDLDNN